MKARGTWAAGVTAGLIVWWALVVRADRWPSGDGPHVLGASMRLALDLRAGDFEAFVNHASTLLAPHPPGAYLPWTLAYALLGTGRHAHLLASAALLGLCLDAIRRLGSGLSGALWLAAPALLWIAAEGGSVDLVGAACASQALSWLAVSDRLKRTGPASAWGGWMALGFLSKYTFPMFLWAPCLLAGIWVIREKQWRHLGLAVIVFAVVAGPWYAGHLGAVIRYIGGSMAPDPLLVAARDLASGPWYAWANITWYPAALLDAWGWVGVLGLGVGLFGARRREAPWEARALVLAAVLGAWFALGQSVQRQDRYMLPAIPLLAAVAGASRRERWFVPVAGVGLLATAWRFGAAEDAPSNRNYGHDIARAGRSWPWPAEAYSPVSQDPRPWRVEEAIAGLRARHGRDDGTVGLLLDDGRGAPGMGVYLFCAASAGLRWDFATVSIGTDSTGRLRDMTFVGPFATEDWPSRDYTALYAAFEPGDPTRQRWMQDQGLDFEATQPLPWGWVGGWMRR